MSQQVSRVGVTVSKFQGMMPSELLRGLRLLGIEFIEINRDIFEEIDAVANNLGAMRTAFHLPLIAEDGWDFSCLDYRDDITTTIQTINQYKEKLRIQHVVSHPPEPALLSDPQRSSINFLYDNLAKLNVPVYLENVPGMVPDEFLSLYWSSHKALGPQLAGMCFDAPHFFVTGHNPIETFTSFADHVGCIHLSDCLHDKDVHLPFNSGGELPVNEFLQTLEAHRFNGYVTLEIKPKSLQDIDAYIESYVTTLRHVNYKKYLKTKLRLFALRPILNRFAA